MKLGPGILLLLVLPSVLLAQTRWFPSDSLGTWSLDSAAAVNPGKGWWMGVSTEADMQKQWLFHDGVETQQRWLEWDSAQRPLAKRTFVDGVMTSELHYQPGTTLAQSETIYLQGSVSSVIRYTWASSGLISRHIEDAKGAWLWDDRIYRYPDGRLRRLERTGPEGPVAQISWSTAEDGSPEVWIQDEDLLAAGKHKVVTTGSEGIREDLWLGAELLSSRVTDQRADGSSQLRETLLATGQVTDRMSDSRGRLVSETISLKDKTSQMTRWTWDDQDRVIQEESSIRGGWETTDYRYPESGLVVLERRRLGEITSRETRKDGEKILVELFDKGQKFLEEEWSAGRKVRERYYQDGLLVRERQR